MQKVKIDFYRLKICVISSFIFGLLAHAFRYFNTMFSADILNRVFIDEAVIIGKYEQGRFFNHVFMLFRNLYAAPWLIGAVSILFVALSAYLITDLFNINSIAGISLLSGLFVVNHTLTLINSSFVYVADVYMETVFLYTLAGYILVKQSKWYFVVLSAVLTFLGLGAYQSYVPIVPLIVLIWSVFKAFDNEEIGLIIRKNIAMLISIVISAVLYVLGILGFIYGNGLKLASRSKGLKSVYKNGISGVFVLIKDTYMYVLKFFLQRTFYNSNILRITNGIIIIFLVAGIVIVLLKKKTNVVNRVYAIFAIALLPFVMNAVFFLFGEKTFHHLMTYHFLYLYIFAFLLGDYLYKMNAFKKNFLNMHINKVSYICIGVVIYASILFSNDIYLKKALEYEDTQLVFNRIIERIEELDNYKVDKENELVFIGNLAQSDLALQRYGFEQLYDDFSMSSSFATTTYIKYKGFIEYIMNYPITVVDKDAADEYANMQEVIDMPCFPTNGSVKVIDGKIIVKISEEEGN